MRKLSRRVPLWTIKLFGAISLLTITACAPIPKPEPKVVYLETKPVIPPSSAVPCQVQALDPERKFPDFAAVIKAIESVAFDDAAQVSECNSKRGGAVDAAK